MTHCCVPRCTTVKTRGKSCHAVPQEDTRQLKWFKVIFPPEEVGINFEVKKSLKLVLRKCSHFLANYN